MKAILIRDDDIGFFTDIRKFQTVHRVLLENGVPFNVAVVPCVRADIRSPNGGYEGFIKPAFHGKNRCFSVAENTDLISFLRKNSCVEIAQHGFSHKKTSSGLPEFAEENAAECIKKLEKGSQILEQTFGRRCAFFVPPYDTVSKMAMQCIRKRYQGISLSRFGHSLLPMHLWLKHQILKKMRRYCFKWKDFIIVQHPGLDFSFCGSPGDIENTIRSIRDVLVLPMHSWNFFSPEGKLDANRLSIWEKELKIWIRNDSVRFIRFSEIRTFGGET